VQAYLNVLERNENPHSRYPCLRFVYLGEFKGCDWPLFSRVEGSRFGLVKSKGSEGQEKYLWEQSITPVRYFTGAIKNHSRAVSHGTGTILHGENEVFQRNRNDFPQG
jgi:hypothetical protein